MYFSGTFESVGNALAVAESGVFDESETKVYSFNYYIQWNSIAKIYLKLSV